MNSFVIAYRSIQQRGIASALTMLSMALGVMLVVAVLSIHGVVSASFRNNSSLGYNMIIGAKGGQEQLVLNTVFYLSRPVENVSYEYYLEFLKQAERDVQLKNSLKRVALESRQAAAKWTAHGGPLGELSSSTVELLDATREIEERRTIEFNRHGKYGRSCEFAIPVCLGDYLDRFRVVGTTPQMFDALVLDVETNRKFEFARGRNFETKSQEHGYFEAVLGATVARELNMKVGDQFSPAHGVPGGHTHERKFTVVGVLAPSGSPNDRAAFVNIEGFYLMEDHAQPLEEEEIVGSGEKKAASTSEPTPQAIERVDDPAPLPLEQREVTAFLVRTSNPLFAQGLQKAVNEGVYAQGVFPTLVIYNLFDFIVRPIQQIFLLLTVMICFVSGISILVSIYNSMSERRHEIAVMRALGASRDRIMFIVLLEAILLALGGGLLGWLLGHTFVLGLSPYIEQQTGVVMRFLPSDPKIGELVELFGSRNTGSLFMKTPAEIILLPFVLLLAVLVGLWPAYSAYQTDVAKSLGK